MSEYSKSIVYLSQSQYTELVANGSITVDGVTVEYDKNNIYVTPQVDPVLDVKVNGQSVVANGSANIPVGSGTLGVVKIGAGTYGIAITSDGTLKTIMPTSADIKKGARACQVLVPQNQHEAVFYGLAKAAGHDEANSTEELGTYSTEAKAAIQSMLGVPTMSEIISAVHDSYPAAEGVSL